VSPGDNLTSIVKRAFGVTDSAGVQSKIREVILLNPAIKNPNLIRIGQILVLTAPPISQALRNTFEADRCEVERLLSPRDHTTRFLIQNWDVIHPLAVGNFSPGKHFETGGPDFFGGSQVGDIAKWGFRIVKGSSKAAEQAANGKFGNLVNVSPHVFQSVEGELIRDVKRQIQYVRRPDNVLGLIPQGTRALKSGAGKVILVQADPSRGLYAFSRSVKDSKNLAKDLLGPAKKVFKVIDYGLYGYNVVQAIGTPTAGKTISKETGKLAAGLAWGAGSTAIASGVCGFLTLTTGPGGIACFLTVIIGGGYGASKLGEWGGGQLYDGGKYLYQSTAPVFLSN